MSSSMRLFAAGLVTTALVGCGDGFKPYYTQSVGPQIGSLEPDFQLGNTGGELVTISGAGFGDDPDQLVVLFDNHNAEVVSATNSEIVVRTPPGPITGGGVEVLVANATGYDLQAPSGDIALYRYGVGVYDGEGQPLGRSPFYRDQQHYVQVSNLYDSCYGGRGTPGCEGNSFNGAVGIDGQGEFYRFAYPRLHTTSLGWLTAYDINPGQWHVGPPRAVFPSGIDDLHKRGVGAFEIINPAYESVDSRICVDLTEDLQFATEVCNDSFGQREYDLGVLEFCQTVDQDDGVTGQFRPDWPVNRDFFESLPGESMDVRLAVYGLQLVTDVTLPPVVDFDAEYGFQAQGTNPWTVSSPLECADENEDGQVTLDEAGMILTWTPLDDSFRENADINSFVHVSLTLTDFAWYSLEQQGVRIAIVVPDNHEVGEDGLARLVIPNEVLYQIPSPNFNWSNASQQSGFLGRYSSNPSYLFMEAYRVTDYRFQTPDDETLVFSYATGELTLLVDYTNPLYRDTDCGDCVDGDGDGWVDARDPDCNEDVGGNGDTEDDSTFGDYTCNDGIDNNGDGLTDADDPLCINGWDGESTCTDGLDNDEDGWLDEDDPDCTGGGEEDGSTVGGTCNDGLDNDGDGWVDAGDPGCIEATDAEDDGLSGTQCNDGVDNDGHGDVDAEDFYCILNGALTDSEEPATISQCRNGADDESDGYVDGLDPDCEVAPYHREATRYFEPADGFAPGCYDNIDNDGDGVKDSADPSCWNPAFGYAPDGFLTDEGRDWGTSCSDGVDSDGDGWIDGLDPDCVPGVSESQEEVGLGTTQCNDGIDNDGDGDIDSEDSLCSRGSGNFEG